MNDMNAFELQIAVEAIKLGILRVSKGGKRLVRVEGKGTGSPRN